MLDQNTLDLIAKLQTGAANLSASKTDDDVLVIYKAQFDPETGEALPSVVAGTVTQDQITAHLAGRETEKAQLHAMLNNFGLALPTPTRKVGKTIVQKSFVAVLGAQRGIATWAWLWGQQYAGHPMIGYWLSFLMLATEGVDANSTDIETALNALLAIPGADGVTPVLSGTEPADIYAAIQAAVD
jgi:hypothetical protein